MQMNPLCYVCDSPATRVCKSTLCSLPPFCCSDPCIKGLSSKMHTHENKQDFITYEEFEKKHQEIKNKLNPHAFHKERLEEMKKKVNLAKDHLQQQINNLDKALEQFERDLCEDLCFKLTEKNQKLMETIESNSNEESINGSNISKWFGKQLLYADQKKVQYAIKQIQEQHQRLIQRILSMDVEKIIISYKEKLQKSKIIYEEGVALKTNKQYKNALIKFKEARTINQFDYLIHFNIIHCQIECSIQLNLIQEKSFQCYLGLNLYHFGLFSHIAQIYHQKGDYKTAIQWYSKALSIQGKRVNELKNRGLCYVEMKQYRQAIDDYSNALLYDPKSQDLKNNKQSAFNELENSIKSRYTSNNSYGKRY